jgi:hypothetical protein
MDPTLLPADVTERLQLRAGLRVASSSPTAEPGAVAVQHWITRRYLRALLAS